MSKIEEYQNKKATLDVELEEVNKNIIISEQSIKQQQEIFQQQFGTIDPEKLEDIAKQYQASIEAKEAELLALEQVSA